MNKEDLLQAQIVKWFRNEYQMHDKGLIFSTPNGGSRNVVEAKKLKTTGTMAGVADLTVLLPNARIIFVELKTNIGKQSDVQLKFENKVKNLNFEYHLIRTIEEFKKLINDRSSEI